MLTISDFTGTEEEYAGVVAAHNGAWPDEPMTLESVKHRDASRSPNYYYRRVLGRVGERIVAVGFARESSWSYRPGKYYVGMDIHADFEDPRHRAQIYHLLVDALFQREPAPVLLTANAREDKAEQVRFLTERGFVAVMRFPRSRLFVDQFDFAPYAGLVERVEAGGIRIASLAELMKSDPEWQRHYYDLDWAGTQDEPSPEPLTGLPFDDFTAQIFGSPNFMPEGIFLALDGDAWVGLSGLDRDLARPDHLETGFTTVLRSHRRRQIATALKLKAIAFAKAYGARTIDTGNEENNPMFQINLRLGFQPQPAWSDYHKSVE